MNMPNSVRSKRGNVLFVGLFILGFGMLSIRSSHAQSSVPAVENVFLITMDGFRWEELFTGADPWLLENEAYTSDREELKSKFWFD